MKQRIALWTVLILMAAGQGSFRWPLNDGTITSSFGESRWDHFHDGVDMVSSDNRAFPVEPGMLLFFWDKTLFPLENYPGGGNYAIVEHRKGLHSVYMHLENGMPRKSIYGADEPLGTIGNTGHSYSRHVHFSLVRPVERSSVNPMALLPPVVDGTPPRITEIAFRIADRIVIVRDNANIRLTRHYPLLVKITDSMSGRENLGIYRLAAFHNGKKTLDVEFKGIDYSGNRLTVQGRGFDGLFDSQGYYKVDGLVYVDGENLVKISAADYAGNHSEKEFRFNVKLDMNEQ